MSIRNRNRSKESDQYNYVLWLLWQNYELFLTSPNHRRFISVFVLPHTFTGYPIISAISPPPNEVKRANGAFTAARG